MNKSQYAWLFALAVTSWKSDSSEPPEGKPPAAFLDNVTARAGEFQNQSTHSANDAKVAALLAVNFLILIWYQFKYRANLIEIGQNGAKKLQIRPAVFPGLVIDETLAIQRPHEKERLFLETDTQCQMISSLTSPAI